jgi:hypothetical protein
MSSLTFTSVMKLKNGLIRWRETHPVKGLRKLSFFYLILILRFDENNFAQNRLFYIY